MKTKILFFICALCATLVTFGQTTTITNTFTVNGKVVKSDTVVEKSFSSSTIIVSGGKTTIIKDDTVVVRNAKGGIDTTYVRKASPQKTQRSGSSINFNNCQIGNVISDTTTNSKVNISINNSTIKNSVILNGYEGDIIIIDGEIVQPKTEKKK